MSKKPNILLLFSDQHRHDVLGCAGHPLVQTPNLDRIAREGARFNRAWCQSPVCQPSRASVITGKYTEELGIFANTGGFDTSWPTVMKSIRDGGYETASIGKTHYHGMPSREQAEKAGIPYDLRQYNEFVKGFGWDYLMEEFDKYVHASRLLRSPYTDYLAAQGEDLLTAYREQIKGIYRLTPTHWRGETSVLPQEHDLTSFIAGEAGSWLSGRNSEKPFFLKLAFVQPHVPLVDDPTWADYYRDADIQLPEQARIGAPNEIWGEYLDRLNGHSQVQTMDDAFIRNGIRHYLGMVSLIDQKIGEILALLESSGQLDDTWIVYTCDHGEMLGEHHLWAKMNFYKGAVQLPLIIRPPGGTEPREVDELVELVDVTATLADMASVSPPDGCRGRSLLPAFDNQDVGREFVRSRISRFSAVRNEQYRFTYDVDTGTPCELFDLTVDPGEFNNLVGESKSNSIIETMMKATSAM